MKKTRQVRGFGAVDADDIIMYIDNTEPLYRQKNAIQTALTRHVCRGGFMKLAAEKGFGHVTDRAAKEMAKHEAEYEERPFYRAPRGYAMTARREANKELVKGYLQALKDCRENIAAGKEQWCELPSEAVALLKKPRCQPGGELTGHRRRR